MTELIINDTLQKEAGEFETEHNMFRGMVLDRSKIIAKKLGVDEAEQIELTLVNSKSKFNAFLITEKTEMAIAYKEGTNQMMTIHPKMTGQLFDNHEEEYALLIDYALLRMYLYEKYGKNANPMAGFFNKYALEMTAQVLSGKFLNKLAEFEIKQYEIGKKIAKRDLEVGMLLYLMRELSGSDFIYEHLDTIFEDCKPTKSVQTIYKKGFDELIMPIKERLLEEQRAEAEKRKKAWQDQRRLRQQVNLDKL